MARNEFTARYNYKYQLVAMHVWCKIYGQTICLETIDYIPQTTIIILSNSRGWGVDGWGVDGWLTDMAWHSNVSLNIQVILIQTGNLEIQYSVPFILFFWWGSGGVVYGGGGGGRV